ncbi:MAG: hypothetical protein ACE5Q6_02555 [Dehalococcoidia bacterium]
MSQDHLTFEVAGTVTDMSIEGDNPIEGWDRREFNLLVSRTVFQVSERQYKSVKPGYDVVLTLETEVGYPDQTPTDFLEGLIALEGLHLLEGLIKVVGIRQGTAPEALQLTSLELQDAEERERNPLGQGIDAKILEHDPQSAPGDESDRPWFEIANSPIQWVEGIPGFLGLASFNCYVPDSRIGGNATPISIRINSSKVKSFPLFGRVKGIRWNVQYSSGHPGQGDQDLSSRLTEFLSQDAALGKIQISGGGQDYSAESVAERGCWSIFVNDDWPIRWWSDAESIAQHLLAMPLSPPE